MEVRLNLATRPLENTRRFVALSSVAGVVLLVMLAVLSASAFRTWKENREIREEMNRLQSELRDFGSQRRDLDEFFKRDTTKRVMDRAAFLNGLIEQRSFPWTRIFMDLEGLMPVGTRVVSLAPRREEGRIQLKMVVGARNDEAKVRFLRAIEESPEFERVIVNSESRSENNSVGDDPITIEIAARYRAFDNTPAAGAPRVAQGGARP